MLSQLSYSQHMKDLPQIPFIRNMCSDLSEEEIKDLEQRTYQLCKWVQNASQGEQLTDEDDAVE